MAADIWHGTGAILGGVLLQCGAVLIWSVCCAAGSLAKATAWLGIVMHSLDLAHVALRAIRAGGRHCTHGHRRSALSDLALLVGRRLLQLAAKRAEIF